MPNQEKRKTTVLATKKTSLVEAYCLLSPGRCLNVILSDPSSSSYLVRLRNFIPSQKGTKAPTGEN
jgi:hypothetical protein